MRPLPDLGLVERPVAEWREPTRLGALVFRLKVTLLRARRGAQNMVADLPRYRPGQPADYPLIVAESRTKLWSDPHPGERAMQLGKVQNLRAALRRLDRIALDQGALFSFWRQIGRATAGRGFVAGRMQQQGCLVPATGGGLCQLSNALYDVALQAGCAIVERHAHSRIVPGSAAAFGRDATVAWNYVDLRFRASQPLLLEARLTRDALVLRLRGREAAMPGPAAPPTERPPSARSCASCNETSCFRHEVPSAIVPAARKAYLLDENWPEIRRYLAETRSAEDVLGIPLDGGRWRLDRYRWPTDGVARIETASIAALHRTIALRRARPQGPERRQAEIDGAARIARRLGQWLSADITEAVVAQSLLPTLWRDGLLGGRGFSVVMTRLPMAVLQARLDEAVRLHPERATLSDFRAPAALVEAEAEALAAADQVVTPHREIAALFPGRAVLLDWVLPPSTPCASERPRRIAFPGPSIARKGAYELRAALDGLDIEVMLLGNDLEGADFWRGCRVIRPHGGAWTEMVAAVVQPALVEERPRALLAALAAGLPVIATPACGLPAGPGLTLVPMLDAEALRAAILRSFAEDQTCRARTCAVMPGAPAP